MRPTSPHTRDLIRRLHGGVGSADCQTILSEIADSNEPAAIVDILPMILYRGDVAFAAAAALHKLLLGIAPRELAWLDSALRQRSTYAVPDFYEWHKISPGKVGEFERFGSASFSLIALASFHQSGYVRENAIRRLSLITTGAEVPFLILRLNDWVSNIRDAAYTAIQSRIKPEYCQAFITSQPLLSRLEFAGRADHKEIISSINGLLKSDQCRTALFESLRSQDRFIRRASFIVALDLTEPDLKHVVTQGLKDDDTVIRRWAAQKISTAFEGETLKHFVELMKRDRFMPVRREALRIAIELNPDRAVEELHNALLDSHQSIREEARYRLQKTQPIDVAAFYRQLLVTAEGPALYSAIIGLGETGGVEDDRLIVPYATHPTSKIRSAAIRALAKLNQRAHLAIFVNALKDEIPHVSRQALKALPQKSSSVSPESIWEILNAATQVHIKRNSLSAMEKLGKWDTISLLIRALSDKDEVIIDMSRSAIEHWLRRFNRSFSSPTPQQLRKLKDALRECDNLLDEETKDHLLFLMKGFG